MATITINLKQLNKELKMLTVKEADSYLLSYQHFINFFSVDRELTVQDLVIGSHFVYGWMPTILNLDLSLKDEVLRIINKAKNPTRINSDEFETLRKCINNSIVGASKLLHFINPNKYAIWDKRINRYATNRSHYGMDKSDIYFDYLRELNNIELEPGFKDFHFEVNKMMEYDVSPKRAIEWVMFETDKLRHPKTTKNEIITTS